MTASIPNYGRNYSRRVSYSILALLAAASLYAGAYIGRRYLNDSNRPSITVPKHEEKKVSDPKCTPDLEIRAGFKD